MYPRISDATVTIQGRRVNAFPSNALDITQIMRLAIKAGGRIASFVHDYQKPPYRVRKNGRQDTYPETVPYHQIPRVGKGDTIILTPWMDNYLKKINSKQSYDMLHTGNSGWFNSSQRRPQAVQFGGNPAIVTDIVGNFAQLWAIPANTENLDSTYFTENGRFAIMKFTAITQGGKIIKPGPALDAYMPFICNEAGKCYTALENLEFWERLPFTLNTGAVIEEYLTLGNDIWGLDAGNIKHLLYTPARGFVTNWKLETAQPPP